jgi:hypothetical protein
LKVTEMKGSHRSRILALAAGLGFLASSASSWQREAALGADGELYTVKQGLYRELFPNAPEGLADRPVLALEVVRAGEPAERHLVPGTEDAAAERTPTLLFEDSSNAAFLVWETSINYHPIIKLASFDGGRFAPEIEVRGSAFGFKSSPQIAVTRDAYTAAGDDGEPVSVSRTLLHLIWAEEGGEGTRTKYVPLILENGEYIGHTDIVELNRFDPSSTASLAYELSDELVRAPTIQPGRDSRTVVTAFADAESKRMVTLEITVLPRELSRLADKARNVIIDIGARVNYPKNLNILADRAREAILGQGGAFQPEVVQAIADRVSEEIRKPSERPLQSLAGEARNVIIDIGARLSGPALRNSTALSKVAPQILEVQRDEPSVGEDDGMSPSHMLQFRVASSRPAPRVQPGAATVLTSRSGDEVLIAVAQEDRVIYRDSKGEGGWNEPRELKLSERMSLNRAYDILYERIRDR